MNLFELTDAWKNFELVCDENGEVVNADEMEQLQMDLNEKVANCLYYIKNLEADKEMYGQTIKEFQKKKYFTENKIDRMKKYVADCLNGEKWESNDCPLKAGYHTSYALDIRDEIVNNPAEYLPAAYLKEKVEINKTELKNAIKNGADFDGCRIVEKKSLMIR